MFRRFNSSYQHDDCFSTLNENELENSAKKIEPGRQILMSFTGDPYANVDTSATRKALEILNKYGHHVAILTKGGKRCLRDIDIFKQFGDRIKVGATLSVTDEHANEWEPGAALPSERIYALKELDRNGVKTWVSFEPVIITDDALHLLNDVLFVDHIKVGKINGVNLSYTPNWCYFTYEFVNRCRTACVKVYVKDSLRPYIDSSFLIAEETDQDFLNV